MRPLVSMQQIGLQWEKRRHHIFSNVINRIHFILGNDDIQIKSLNEFDIWRDPTMDTELAALERLKKSHRLIMEKMTSSHCLRYFSSDPFHTCRQ